MLTTRPSILTFASLASRKSVIVDDCQPMIFRAGNAAQFK